MILKKEELKDGMKVVCILKGILITDAEIHIDSYDKCYYLCQNLLNGYSEDESLVEKYKYAYFLNGEEDAPDYLITLLVPANLPDLEYLYEGAIIEETDSGNKREILGICGKAILVSEVNNYSQIGDYFTIEELKKLNYTIEIKTPKKKSTTVSFEEIAKLTGISENELKISKKKKK